MEPTAELVRSTVTATVPADDCDPATLWRLLAEPRWWSRWAPHIRRARPVPRQAGAALLAAYRPVALLALHRLVALARDRA